MPVVVRWRQVAGEPARGAGSVPVRREESERSQAWRGCSARVRGIDALRVATEVLEDALDDGGVLDAGEDAQPPTATPAGLDVDAEDALEALCLGHRPISVGV